MSYYATLLRCTDSDWSASDLDLDDVESLDELAELIEEHAEDAETAVLVVAHEEEWFGVVRNDAGEDDPRVFVSDAQAALRHALGEVLLPELAEELAVEAAPAPPGPAGEATVLADLGVSPSALASLAVQDADTVVLEVATRLGAGDALESVR